MRNAPHIFFNKIRARDKKGIIMELEREVKMNMVEDCYGKLFKEEKTEEGICERFLGYLGKKFPVMVPVSARLASQGYIGWCLFGVCLSLSLSTFCLGGAFSKSLPCLHTCSQLLG